MTVARDLTNPSGKFKINWTKMPPALITAIKAGKVPTEADRLQFVKRLVEDVRFQVPHAERNIFVDIAKKVQSQFPNSFADIMVQRKSRLANPISLTEQMQNNFDNERRREKTDLEKQAPGRNNRAIGCIRWQLVALPPGESEERQESKRLELQQIFQSVRRRQWDWTKILQGMEDTFGTLRGEINAISEMLSEFQTAKEQNREPTFELPPGKSWEDYKVSTVTERWPFLMTLNGATNHFRTLTGYDLDEALSTFVQEHTQQIIDFFIARRSSLTKPKMNRLKTNYLKYKNDDNVESLNVLTVLLMLCCYFDEKCKYIVRKVDVSFKRLEMVRNYVCLKPFLIIIAPVCYRREQLQTTSQNYMTSRLGMVLQ